MAEQSDGHVEALDLGLQTPQNNDMMDAAQRQDISVEPGSAKKKSSRFQGFGKKLKGWVIAGLVGILIGVCGTLFALSYNPPDEPVLTNPSVVLERIKSQNEMVSVSQDYCIVDKTTSTNRLFNILDLPWTTNSFWYRYAGTIKAGVNLESAEIKEEDENKIIIKLDNPYIISNTVDPELTEVLEEKNNILNPIHIEDLDAFYAECRKTSEETAIQGGLFEEAKTQAITNLQNMFHAALGDECEVEVEFNEE